MRRELWGLPTLTAPNTRDAVEGECVRSLALIRVKQLLFEARYLETDVPSALVNLIASHASALYWAEYLNPDCAPDRIDRLCRGSITSTRAITADTLAEELWESAVKLGVVVRLKPSSTDKPRPAAVLRAVPDDEDGWCDKRGEPDAPGEEDVLGLGDIYAPAETIPVPQNYDEDQYLP
jgi:hypothetical protein